MYPINWKLRHNGNIIIKNDKKDFRKSYSVTFNAMDNIADILNNFECNLKMTMFLSNLNMKVLLKKLELNFIRISK